MKVGIGPAKRNGRKKKNLDKAPALWYFHSGKTPFH
jgi:hypothetical protein